MPQQQKLEVFNIYNNSLCRIRAICLKNETPTKFKQHKYLSLVYFV